MRVLNYRTLILGFFVLTALISIAKSEICVNTDNDPTFKQQVLRTLEEGKQSVLQFKEKIENKDVVIFLGSTKSGKSSITNYLIGTDLEAYNSGIRGLKIKEKRDIGGPKIGQTSLSGTSVPGVYPVLSNPDMMVVDSPGFDDNRGPVQNLINALYINQIKHARTVKFVMVADIYEVINDNVNIFMSSLQQMHELLQGGENIPHPSVAIIFTKVADNWTEKDIRDLLQKRILNDDLDASKLLIENIISNPRLIGIFRAPSKEGEIVTDLGVNLLRAIEESETIDMNQFKVTFTLSEETRTALLEVYPEYIDTNYFKGVVGNITEEYQNYFQEKWVYASFDEELTSTKSALETKQFSIKAHYEKPRVRLHEILQSLQALLGVHPSKEFLCSFEFISILDQSSVVEEDYRAIIDANYGKSLEQLLNKINSLLESIQKELQGRELNHIKFPSECSFVDMATTITYGLLYKSYDFTKEVYTAAADTVSNVVEAIPDKAILPQAVHAVLNIAEEKKKIATLQEICSTAEKAAEVAIAYGPKALAVSGLVGIGVGGSASYFVYHDIYGKRFEVRKSQGRRVYSCL